MTARKKSIRKSRSLEDKSHMSELQRSEDVKTYAAAVRQLVRRSIPMRVISLIVGGYIVWLITYVVGIFGVGPSTDSGQRRIALLVSIGWFAATAFFVIPVIAMIYRSRWFRVNAPSGVQPTQPPTFYDQDRV